MHVTPQEMRFDTRAEYSQAIDTLLDAARDTLCVFDPDLKESGFESRNRADALSAFLSLRRGQIRLVLHDPEHLTRYCPRIMSLFTHYGHRFSIHQTPNDLRLLTDCFMLADEGNAVIRFHADHFRGKLLLANPEETKPWHQRFDELWEVSPAAVSATRLGL